MDFKSRIEFNQLIKEKINERILKRKTLKQELLRLNGCRVKIECQINEQNQKLYLMGLNINDSEYEDKVSKLEDDSKKEEANSCRDKINELRKELYILLDEIKATFLEYNKLF